MDTGSGSQLNERLVDVLRRQQVQIPDEWNGKELLSEKLLVGGYLDSTQVNVLLEDASGYRSMNPALVSFASSFIERMKLLVPFEIWKEHSVFPIKQDGNYIHLVMADPFDERTEAALEAWTGSRLEKYICNGTEIHQCIEKYFAETGTVLSRDIGDLIEQSKQQISKILHNGEAGLTNLVNSPYVISLLRQILENTVNRGASDIHFEMQRNSFWVRARLDGVLHKLYDVDKAIGKGIIPRIKMIAGMKWESFESGEAQDGRIDYHLIEGHDVDIRVSAVPAFFGEKIVFRIFEKNKKQLALADLIPIENQRLMLTREIHKPNGLVLLTGPTGCGKTTTLYTFLAELNTEYVNISTAEDPIENTLPGITQISCDGKKGVTFASILRALLRQDPDIMMVGEIRDAETADIAVKAASTGHLVFSTLHTNDATGAIARMINLGVPPFLLASCGLVVVAQRLLRVICNTCKAPYTPDESESKLLGSSISGPLFKGTGCDECGGTGYKGRTSVMEILKVNEKIERQIMEQRPLAEIKQEAIANGMVLLREDALIKMNQGITTPEEVLRITLDS